MSGMKRSTVIATCLVNARIVADLASAERTVEHCFRETFPGFDYKAWNRDMDFRIAREFIRNARDAGRINIARFMSDIGKPG